MTVHYSVNISRFIACSNVFYQLIGMHHIISNLWTPFYFFLFCSSCRPSPTFFLLCHTFFLYLYAQLYARWFICVEGLACWRWPRPPRRWLRVATRWWSESPSCCRQIRALLWLVRVQLPSATAANSHREHCVWCISSHVAVAAVYFHLV